MRDQSDLFRFGTATILVVCSVRSINTNFDVSLTLHLSITFVKTNLTHNIFVL
jgi:hypothetical protein